MKQRRKLSLVVCMIALMGTLLMACGDNTDNDSAAATSTPPAETTATAEPAAEARAYTDYMGHETEIPTAPKRVVFHGETLGDLVALGVDVVGTDMESANGMVFQDKLSGVTDVGFPIDLEKTLDLSPDLIFLANTDETLYESVSKIAPTINFDTFAPIEERMLLLGDLLGKKQEAEAWLANYNAQVAAMWEEIKASGMKEGETASVITYYPGDRLFIMATAGLPQFLYNKDGFKTPVAIQKVIDEGTGFVEISKEVLPDFAGDRIFILNPVSEEAQKSTEDMKSSVIWKNLPAVKNGYVYSIDILKASSDASTREWLISELPTLMKQ